MAFKRIACDAAAVASGTKCLRIHNVPTENNRCHTSQLKKKPAKITAHTATRFKLFQKVLGIGWNSWPTVNKNMRKDARIRKQLLQNDHNPRIYNSVLSFQPACSQADLTRTVKPGICPSALAPWTACDAANPQSTPLRAISNHQNSPAGSTSRQMSRLGSVYLRELHVTRLIVLLQRGQYGRK